MSFEKKIEYSIKLHLDKLPTASAVGEEVQQSALAKLIYKHLAKAPDFGFFNLHLKV